MNGFLGLALDNITQLIILSSLLIGVFKFPRTSSSPGWSRGRRWARARATPSPPRCVIGVGAAVGILSWLVALLPEAAVAPILIFIGLEITAQGFLASPPRHGPAVAIGFIPVAAALVAIQAGGLLAGVGKTTADLSGEAAASFLTLSVLGNGFILTALLWSSAVVFIIDGAPRPCRRRVRRWPARRASADSIHSPLPSGALFWPWAASASVSAHLAGAYGVVASLCCLAALRRGRCRAA